MGRAPTVHRVETYRILLSHVDIDGVPVEFDYGDVYVVVREGDAGPGPTDWEAQLRTEQYQPMLLARHEPSGATYSPPAAPQRAVGGGAAAAVAQPVEELQHDENDDLEIPSFLRRLAN